MTNELEKQFFDTFGIEPKKQCYYWDCPYSTGNIVNDTAMNERDCNSCKNPNKEIYPQITNRILLELICILGNTSYFLITDDGLPIDVDGLKKSVLHSLTLQAKIDKNKVLKHQVRTLFEEG